MTSAGLPPPRRGPDRLDGRPGSRRPLGNYGGTSPDARADRAGAPPWGGPRPGPPQPRPARDPSEQQLRRRPRVLPAPRGFVVNNANDSGPARSGRPDPDDVDLRRPITFAAATFAAPDDHAAPQRSCSRTDDIDLDASGAPGLTISGHGRNRIFVVGAAGPSSRSPGLNLAEAYANLGGAIDNGGQPDARTTTTLTNEQGPGDSDGQLAGLGARRGRHTTPRGDPDDHRLAPSTATRAGAPGTAPNPPAANGEGRGGAIDGEAGAGSGVLTRSWSTTPSCSDMARGGDSCYVAELRLCTPAWRHRAPAAA